jgi:tRNA threonylcarbamoyladenosine biosynthesis protein TsaE
MSHIDAQSPAARHLTDAAATRKLGRRLADRLPAGALLLLHGELGAGKTCLVQGLAEGLGIREAITSPTFALAQHYGGRRPEGGATALVHLDLYRLEEPAAADELFAQEEEEARALGAVLAVEWPERLSFLPKPCWRVELDFAGEGRRARIWEAATRNQPEP